MLPKEMVSGPCTDNDDRLESVTCKNCRQCGICSCHWHVPICMLLNKDLICSRLPLEWRSEHSPRPLIPPKSVPYLANITLSTLDQNMSGVPEFIAEHAHKGGCRIALGEARVRVIEDEIPPTAVLPSWQLKHSGPPL